MPVIGSLTAREILDSRGRPTVEATCSLQGGARASASVPSGASTGAAEAVELRDNDPGRYRGLGCRTAAANVSGPIQAAVRGREFAAQGEFDSAIAALDGTENKSRLGANAILAASLAFARAAALAAEQPLWSYFADLAGAPPAALPRLTINLFSGGMHAGRQVAIQDVLIVPAAAHTIDESLAVAYDVYYAAADLIRNRYGMRLLRADEGGMAPPCRTPEEMIETALDAIRAAGYAPGAEVALALDVAASHFRCPAGYRLGEETLTSGQMIDRIRRWVGAYPLVSVEDGLAEDDWESWPDLCAAVGGRVLVVGDDLLCTNPLRIGRAARERSANAVLLKVNQIGTLSEALAAYRLARQAGWNVTVSVRSGETEDHWAADLAVGWSGDQFKNGSITQSERLAKYNRLLAIEREVNLAITPWPNRHGLASA
jgi:enolase